jgi:hypothetical protein
MKKLKEILYVFLFCVPFAILVYIVAHIGILIYKLYKMTNPNDIKVKDADIVSNEFSAVIRQLDIEDAKQTLMGAGYFVDNLWCVEDVMLNYDCTKEEAQEVLSNALQNDATMQQIWEAISYKAESMNLKRRD